jgi:ATP-dependent protease ClpP protease subunit
MPKPVSAFKAGPYQIRAAANDETTAEVLIYGDIGESWWGESVDAKSFVENLQEVDADYLTVRINSYGGSVKDGIAIHNAIKRHPAATTVEIDGMAVSIASLIAMAGDTVQMAENAMLMIHAPWSMAVGNAVDMREMADVLDMHADSMATSYAAKTGKPVDEILDILKDGKDHWFTAADALEDGWIDEISGAVELDAAASLNTTRFSIPAAMAAAITPKKEPEAMTIKTDQAAKKEPADNINVADIEEAAKAKALKEDRERREGIAKIAAPFMQYDGMQEVVDACKDDPSIDLPTAQAKILAKLGSGAEPINKNADVVVDARDKFKAGASAALLVRSGVAKRDDTANNYRGHSLVELARAALEQAGTRTDTMDKMAIVAAAFTHSTSDFTNLLADVAHKSMLMGHEEAEETFQAWTNRGVLTDFKPMSRVDLNAFPSLLEVREGAEFKSATVGDRGEQIQLATYGRLFSISRQAIINDDLAAFTTIPRKMGRAAIRTVGDLAYAVLTANGNMADGTALFHADHSNLLTGAGINTGSIDAMRVKMAKQKSGDATLGIRLANLIVPVALEGSANVARDSEFEVGASTKNNTTPNSVRGTFEVISDARLDAASATTWYGTANAAIHDTVEVAYLDGNDQPYLEQQNGWTVDGTEFKVRIDAGVKALDHLTMAKNPGA